MKKIMISFLGPLGSFSHEAANKIYGNFEFVLKKSFPEVFSALSEGVKIIVPIDNSIEGLVA